MPDGAWSVPGGIMLRVSMVSGFPPYPNSCKDCMPQIAAETSPDSLRGLEGIGAAAYFSVLDEMILQGKETFSFASAAAVRRWTPF